MLLETGTDAFAVSGPSWLDQPGLPTELCTLMAFCPSNSIAWHAGHCDAPEPLLPADLGSTCSAVNAQLYD